MHTRIRVCVYAFFFWPAVCLYRYIYRYMSCTACACVCACVCARVFGISILYIFEQMQTHTLTKKCTFAQDTLRQTKFALSEHVGSAQSSQRILQVRRVAYSYQFDLLLSVISSCTFSAWPFLLAAISWCPSVCLRAWVQYYVCAYNYHAAWAECRCVLTCLASCLNTRHGSCGWRDCMTAAVSRLEGNIMTIMHSAMSMGNADRMEQSTAKQHSSNGNDN